MNEYTLKLFLPLFLSLGLLKFAFDAPAIFKNIVGSFGDAMKGKFNGLAELKEMGANAKKASDATFGRVKKGFTTAKKGFDGANKAGRGVVGGVVGFKAGRATGGAKGALRGMIKGSRAAKDTKLSWLDDVKMKDVRKAARTAGRQVGVKYMNPQATRLSEVHAEYGKTINTIYNDDHDTTGKLAEAIKRKESLESNRDTGAANTKAKKYDEYIARKSSTRPEEARVSRLRQEATVAASAGDNSAAKVAWNNKVEEGKKKDLATSIAKKKKELGRELTDSERDDLKLANNKKWGIADAATGKRYAVDDHGNIIKDASGNDVELSIPQVNGLVDEMAIMEQKEDFKNEVQKHKHDDLAREIAKKEKELGPGKSIDDVADATTGETYRDQITKKNNEKWGAENDAGEWCVSDNTGTATESLMSDAVLAGQMADLDADIFKDGEKAKIDATKDEIAKLRADLLSSEDFRQKLINSTDDMIKEQKEANANGDVEKAYEAAIKSGMASFKKDRESAIVVEVARNLGISDPEQSATDYDKLLAVYDELKKIDLDHMDNDHKRALKAITGQISKVVKNTQSEFSTRQELFAPKDDK